MRSTSVIASLVLSVTTLVCIQPALGPRVATSSPAPALLDVLDRLDDLEAKVATLETALAEERVVRQRVDQILANFIVGMLDGLKHFSRVGDDIYITGANLHIVNGTGTTHGATNSVGNLIIGYNEERTLPMDINDRTGSHMLVVGKEHNYSSYGGIVVGFGNTTGGAYSSVSGGHRNTASGLESSVSGGTGNTANAHAASVSGGQLNKASDFASSVSGGQNNTASGRSSSVSGGRFNTASDFESSVSGGENNRASGEASSVSGGRRNTAGPGEASSVSGGRRNTASGLWASVSGGGGPFSGDGNIARGDYSSISGGRSNEASGQNSSVSGGRDNLADADYSSVSGGFQRVATVLYEWLAGLVHAGHH